MVELKYTELKKKCSKKHLPISKVTAKTTETDAVKNRLIGQEVAADALKLGLSIKSKGFNVYISGQHGSGRTSHATAFAQDMAKSMPAPPDLCYVHNFKSSRHPRLLTLPSGTGLRLQEDMNRFIGEWIDGLQKEFSSKEFEAAKHEIVKIYIDKREEIVKEISDEAKEQGYGMKLNGASLYFMPIIDGEMLSEEQYDALSLEERDEISKKTELIREKARDVMGTIRDYGRSTQTDVEELEKNRAEVIINGLLTPLYDKYAKEPAIKAFLDDVKEDALGNVSDHTQNDNEDDEYMRAYMPIMAMLGMREKTENYNKYRVNCLTEQHGGYAPVIVEYNPSYASLVGEIEYDSENGSLTTDFMMIKPGFLHKANGGFLILQVGDLLKSASSWDALTKCLLTGKHMIEPNREYQSGVAMSGLRPEACDIDVKVILVGSSYYFHLLNEYDDDFSKLFKIHSVFDYEMPYSAENIRATATFIQSACSKRDVDIESDAVQILIEHLSRDAERQDKLSTRLSLLTAIITESVVYAKEVKIITADSVRLAIHNKEKRASLYEEKISEMISNDLIMIDTDGEKTAQINGLAVYDMSEHAFAKPSRITATTYVGKSGIVNIEKEAEMSGSIHSKGVQVIIGYLGQKYAQNFPLSLSCRVCFEQSYASIDGDSASAAELLTILSSLADAPIRQDLAITGSMNQRGEIQAIGGVTYKIEGFFALCNQRGLTGRQGVIIPYVNKNDLTLKNEVIEAVKAGKFHIYAVKHIDEAIELVTGIPAGTRIGRDGEAASTKDEGKYPANTIHGMVYRKLKKFYRRAIGE
ncbi:MAG: AAA family ATPase [Defluviitaleaceae bacterium]|nr:AAA family ATPase [Defluviitaleaceae bacterium]